MILKDLPDDSVKLQEMLKKLKDKEMRLEADLAIKENPEFEKGIIEIILCISDVRKAEKGVILTRKTGSKKEVDTLKAQIVYFENKLKTLKETLEDMTDGDRSDKMKNDKELAIERLKKYCEEWNVKFSGVDLKELIPSVEDYL